MNENKGTRFPRQNQNAGTTKITFEQILATQHIYSWQSLLEVLSEPIQTPEIIVDLLRHGESVTNAQNLITGRSDVDLTALGRNQAKVAGSELDHHYDLAWCSGLRRSKDTLDIALSTHHTIVEQIISDPRLDERSLGELENKEFRNIDAYAKGDFTYAPINGESYAKLTQRCLSFLLDLTIIARHRNTPLKVLVSTHVGPMRIIWGIAEGECSPINVLAKTFRNTHVERLVFHRLAWPPFLQPVIVQSLEPGTGLTTDTQSRSSDKWD